jgi:hypothetical protein
VLQHLREKAVAAGVPLKWQNAQAQRWLDESTLFAHAVYYFYECHCDKDRFADYLVDDLELGEDEAMRVADFVCQLTEHLEYLGRLQERDNANQAKVRGNGVVFDPLSDVDRNLLVRAFGSTATHFPEAPHSKRNYVDNKLYQGKSFTSNDDIKQARKPRQLHDSRYSKPQWYADQISRASASKVWL